MNFLKLLLDQKFVSVGERMRLRIRIGMMVTWNDFQVEVYVISHWILILIPTIVQHSNPFFTLTVILK